MGDNVVLGLGGAIDYEIAWDPAVVQQLATQYAIQPDELSTSVVVRDERDLLRSLLAFVRDGVGGERFVASSDIVEAFSARFTRRVTLGGTNVRAAVAMSRLGLRSTVHLVSVDDNVRGLLPPQVSFVCSAVEDSTDPHLIVQFPAGARIRVGSVELQAPRANRLIYVNDPPNRELLVSARLGDVLLTATVFLLSGFNAMQDPASLDARLLTLRKHMRSLPAGALVVYEDGGFHVPELSRQIRDGLLDLIDVYGMNEDEMQAYLGHEVKLLDAESVAGALRELHSLIPARTFVVHTKFWSLAVGARSQNYRAALHAGNAMSGVRYLYGDDFTKSDYLEVSRRLHRQDGRDFARAIEALLPGQVCCVPSYHLSSPTPTTVGLGDSFVGGFITALIQAPHADAEVADAEVHNR
jgi:ADP-dependent phosphofructokinase/glucokinase